MDPQLQPFKGRLLHRHRQTELRGFCLCVVGSLCFNIKGNFFFKFLVLLQKLVSPRLPSQTWLEVCGWKSKITKLAEAILKQQKVIICISKFIYLAFPLN